jgi:hypothetical protein
MLTIRSPLVSAFALVLAACTPTQSRQVTENAAPGGSTYPARMALAGVGLPAEAAPLQPKGATWRADHAGAHFGVSGQADLFSLACEHTPDGSALLRITRMTRADDNAKAMFALIGNGRIARLPIDALRAGEPGVWQARIPAADERLNVLRGGNTIEATLPGGGTLKLAPSNEPGRLLADCRASDRAPKLSA